MPEKCVCANVEKKGKTERESARTFVSFSIDDPRSSIFPSTFLLLFFSINVRGRRWRLEVTFIFVVSSNFINL